LYKDEKHPLPNEKCYSSGHYWESLGKIKDKQRIWELIDVAGDEFCFWAEFVKIGNDTFRFDTRIYLKPISKIKRSDHCIGAVVGKNAGSAKSTASEKGLQLIDLDGDKLLPTVRNIIIDSYKRAGDELPKNGYIQVLNLFYLCNPKLNQAISAISTNKEGVNCPTENQKFPWVWYAWGNGQCKKTSKQLNPYKGRFVNLKSNNHFYLDPKTEKVVSEQPSEIEFAKHIQGLTREHVVPYISELIKNLPNEKY